jgi:hypothetical protein
MPSTGGISMEDTLMTAQTAQAKAAAVAAANTAVAAAVNGTPEQKAAAKAQLDRANAMPG